MITYFDKVFEIVSRYEKFSAWQYSSMFEDFNFLRARISDKTLYVVPLARKLLALDGIKYISVSLADCKLPDNIALVDTPGTEFLPENDAIRPSGAQGRMM